MMLGRSFVESRTRYWKSRYQAEATPKRLAAFGEPSKEERS